MAMIGGGNRNSIKILSLFIQHFAVILIVLCFWECLYTVGGPAVMYIAKKSNIGLAAVVKSCNIRFALTANANTGYNEPVAGC
ncbi:hypothetical protein D3C86_1929560 [compost metagenome]